MIKLKFLPIFGAVLLFLSCARSPSKMDVEVCQDEMSSVIYTSDVPQFQLLNGDGEPVELASNQIFVKNDFSYVGGSIRTTTSIQWEETAGHKNAIILGVFFGHFFVPDPTIVDGTLEAATITPLGDDEFTGDFKLSILINSSAGERQFFATLTRARAEVNADLQEVTCSLTCTDSESGLSETCDITCDYNCDDGLTGSYRNPEECRNVPQELIHRNCNVTDVTSPDIAFQFTKTGP